MRLYARELLLLLAASPWVTAQTVTLFNELNAQTAGNDFIGKDGPLYGSFSTGPSNNSLTDVMAKLTVGTGAAVEARHALAEPYRSQQSGFRPMDSGGSVTVALYSDNSTRPGALLLTLGTLPDSSLPAADAYANFDFPVSPAFALQPNTRYWISFSTTNDSIAGLAWTADYSGPGAASEFNVWRGEVFSNTEGAYQMQVTAEPTPAASPPVLPNITGAVNGASYLPQLAAGSWVTIQGTNLSATTTEWASSDFVNNALPTKLDNVSVTINGKAAYTAYISPKQLNILAPDDPAVGPIEVQVTNSLGASNSFVANKAAVAPALFLFTSRYPAAVHANGAYAGPAGLIPGASTTPVRSSEVLLLFGTGFGATDPPTPTGMLFATASPLAESVTATVGGLPADVVAYLISPGLDQFNISIPNLPDGDAPVVLTVAGQSTQDGLFLAIQN